jgi:hypothetical protein
LKPPPAQGTADILNNAKDVVEDRGGAHALKEDAEEVKADVTQEASMTEKAQDVAEDIKDPGAWPLR